MFDEAVKDRENGVYVSIEVVPNSKVFSLSWDQWRKRIKIKIKAKAQRGKANEEIITFFASAGPAKIVKGAINKEKVVFVEVERSVLINFLKSNM